MDDDLSRHIRTFAVLLDPTDEVSVSVIPGAQNDVLVTLRLSRFDAITDHPALDPLSGEFRLHMTRDKAKELSDAILNYLGGA